ncbi:MAG TPA: DUF4214 domain-containing protein [Pirellulales bacterium]|nr:DUF4214 domain-containing protein [Pirellulales bacterium]
MPAALMVNSLSDAVSPGAGEVTLRQAIFASETNGTTALNQTGTGNDTIVFAPGLFGTIDLSQVGDTSLGPSALLINNNVQLTIDGANGASGITIERDSSLSNLRLFNVAAGASLTLESLTLAGGQATGAAGGNTGLDGGQGGGAAGMGGAVFNVGTLNLVQDTLTGNAAQGGAGGSIPNMGSDGGAPGGGPNGGAGGAPGFDVPGGDGGAGGFASGGGGGGPSFTIIGLAFGGDGGAGGFGGGGGGGGGDEGDPGSTSGAAGAGGFGGGAGGGSSDFANPGGGGAGMGGAVFNEAGTVTVTNCTFYGNSATGGASGGSGASAGQGLGGAVFNHNGTLTVLSATFSGNSAGNNAGGVYNLADGATATLTLSNTMLFGDTSGSTADLTAGTSGAGGSTNVTSGVGNLIGAEAGFAGSIVSTSDPGLAALAANGGPTETMAVDTSSPAAGTGNATAASGLTTDQRGAPRFTYGGVDIGAYQINAAPTANAGGPYQIYVGGFLSVDASASSDPDGDTLTYTWDINGDGVFGDAAGVNPTLTWSQLNALGITGTFSTIHLAVEVSDGVFSPVVSTDTTLQVVSAPTPLSPNERFLTALYRSLLDREPDAAGLAAWSTMLDGGVSRTQVALYIEGSGEYLSDEVDSAFERYLRRPADAGALPAFVAMLGQGTTFQDLDVAILSSQEYFQTQGGGTNDGFLGALFQDALGRPIDAPTAALFSGMLSSGVSRAVIVQGVLTSAEYRHDLVNGMYEQYLRRPADPTALAFGVAQLESGETPAILAAEILGSTEYFDRATLA